MDTRRLVAACAFPIALAVSGLVHANVAYTVSLDTSAISGGVNYAVAFSFQDGSLSGDSNNTVTLSNFAFGGGSAGGAPVTFGGASGGISSSVSLVDSDFSNGLAQGFTPGNSLSFRVELTTNVDAGTTPDFFGFSLLLDGTPLPTLDDTTGDNLLYFNIDSADPTPVAWATAAGSDFTLSAPAVSLAPPGPIPEPATVALLGLGLAGIGFWRRK